MKVDDVFTITNRGTVVSGIVNMGKIKLQDSIQIVKLNGQVISSHVDGISIERKLFDQACEGESVGLLLRSVKKKDIDVGDVIVKHK